MLEVIALGPVDAERAEAGGADRIELVADMAADGLSPSPRTVRAVLAATGLPVRVMLRHTASFAATGPGTLRAGAAALLDAGAREFVLGFLTPDGAVDTEACALLAEELAGCPWTFHRAVDHAADPYAAHAALAGLGCDTVLSAGHPGGVTEGLPVLRAVAARGGGPELMAGGGLRDGHVTRLRAAGVRAFHIGGAVRPAGWDEPVDLASVRRWATVVSGAETAAAHRIG
ncbi:copper homeostasis protein CutC [Amycolatopsis antarctica]|uniref:Copper homeostasis protein cutC homolog n=1 Tax=Amycolatopsis antarctica TaxID=1854586 RepID=A0A263CXH0_9PSEU|nr:copper homeostasis protein CutC [Amycolatopsis antarctica]